jgi:hypothetical protein
MDAGVRTWLETVGLILLACYDFARWRLSGVCIGVDLC